MQGQDALIGRVLGGRYRIVGLLGEGGMGAVYEAVQEPLGRRVAVKVLSDELRAEEAFVERFRREAEAAGRLMHPHIVQTTDFGQAPGEPSFIVMELLEGEPLLTALRRGALEPQRAARIAVQLLSALEAAHQSGIVHRDLKPANVFLVPLAGGADCVKLLDFGIAKLKESDGYTRLTQTGVLIGTPRYAAPEQLVQRPTIDARTDVYAVGVLLYGMLAGRPPFTSQGTQLLIDIADDEPTSLLSIVPSLDPRLAEVVRRAMQKRPELRFQSAREMAEAIGQLLQGDAPLSPFAGAVHAVPDESTAAARPGARPPASQDATAAARPGRRAAPAEQPAIPPTAGQMRGVGPDGWPLGAPPPDWSVQAVPSWVVAAASASSVPPPRASFPPTQPVSVSFPPPEPAPRRWGLIALALAGLMALGGAGVGGFLYWQHRELEPDAPPPPPSPPPSPAGEPERYEVSSAARALGPDCVAYETMVCSACPHANAHFWCSRARSDHAAAAGTADAEHAHGLCRSNLDAMTQLCH